MCDFEHYTLLSVRHTVYQVWPSKKDIQKPYRNCEEAARSTECYYDGHIIIFMIIISIHICQIRRSNKILYHN